MAQPRPDVDEKLNFGPNELIGEAINAISRRQIT